MDFPTESVLGAFEQVNFPEFGDLTLRAKIDTGADTGALHCTKIYEEELASGNVLHFSPFGHPEMTETTPNFKVKHVRSSNGIGQSRYFIDTIIKINGKDYPIHLSLADRKDMNCQVLIGKRFLRRRGFVVDVSRNSK